MQIARTAFCQLSIRINTIPKDHGNFDQMATDDGLVEQ